MSNREPWRVVSLGEVATLVKGISYASDDYCGPDEGATFITIKCVSKAGGFKPEGIKYFKGEIPDRQRLKPGDLLIANTDLTRAGDIVGCPITVPKLGGGHITLSMDLSKLIEKPVQIERRFLYYRLMSEDVRSFMKDHASGSTVLHLQTRAVPHLSFDLPPKKEQSKIAEVLATVDQAIEQTEALIAKQQRIKTGLMQDLLTRGIDEHGQLRTEQTHDFKDSSLGRIPVEWEVATLGSVADISAGITLGKTHEGPDTVELPYLRVANVQDGFLDLSELKTIRIPKNHLEKYALEVGDVLMNEGGDFDKLGRGAVWEGQVPVCMHQNHVFKVRPHKHKLASDFLAAVSASPYGKSFFMMASKQSTNLASINSTQLKSFPLPLPSHDEQIRIQNHFKRLDGALQGSQAELKKQKSLKTALMQDLLTGRKRVNSLLNSEVSA